MSLAILSELQQELRRLAVAGCTLAAGDFKLKKINDRLKQMSKEVPLFLKISQYLEQVINPVKEQLPHHFLDLVNFVNAVLFTQGRTGMDGEPEELEVYAFGHDTYVSFRKLEPLITALTTKGSGRYKIILESYEARLFNDLRIIPYAVKAMGDSYGEIADFISTKVIPRYGKAVLPLLQKEFNRKGGKIDARRLKLIYKYLGKEEGKEFVLDAVEKSSTDIRIAAIGILKEYPDCDEVLEGFAQSSNKAVKNYAVQVLKEKDSILGKIKSFFKKK